MNHEVEDDRIASGKSMTKGDEGSSLKTEIEKNARWQGENASLKAEIERLKAEIQSPVKRARRW